MNFNWPIIGDKIFGILKGSGFRLQMFDKTGNKILDPHEATRFFASIKSHDPKLKTYSILVTVHDENRNSHIDIKTPKLRSKKDFDFVAKIKRSITTNIGEREGLSINWFVFNHTIKPRDETMNNITESKDISKVDGTTKSSFQKIGNSRLIIRHSERVNEEKQGSRWRHIKSIFVENSIGERLKYPYIHIAGARAMARHFANDGSMHDEIGEAIQHLSDDYIKLKKSARLLKHAGDDSLYCKLRESLKEINKKVKKLSGPRGYGIVTDSLVENQTAEDDACVNQTYEQLLELCKCNEDSDQASALKVASRYLADSEGVPAQVKFKCKPDISSDVHKFTDQKQRFAWQVEVLAKCVEDADISTMLLGIAKLIKNGSVLGSDDKELLKTVYKSSKAIGVDANFG